MTTGVTLAPGGGSWGSVSDRNAKDDFRPVDTRGVLKRVAALPIQTWRYKGQHASVRHIGPVAQDFRAAFDVGEDERHITSIDADGVALAAIQGLHEIVQEKETAIASLREQNRQLEARLAAIEAALKEKQP
jgi:hypothetical protein